MNTKLLTDLYNVYSPSYGEKPMRKFIKRYVRSIGVNNLYSDNGNLYITKGNSDTYPCIVAHMDQVQRTHKNFRTAIFGDVIFGYDEKSFDTSIHEAIVEGEIDRQGLGADDKNGIWVALECLKKYDNIKVAFFMGEECGCVGSSKADKKFFEDVRWVVQCDRRNGGDFITSIFSQITSDDFINDCGYKDFGYEITDGLTSDVAELAELGIGVSCCNLSCGYYNPHTDEEYTRLSELENCLHFVEHIIETCTDVYPFTYVDSWKSYGSYGSRGVHCGSYGDHYGNYGHTLRMSDYEDWYGKDYDCGGFGTAKKSVKNDNYAYSSWVWDECYDIMVDLVTYNDLNWEMIKADFISMFPVSDLEYLKDIYDCCVYDYTADNDLPFSDTKNAKSA